jgi:hypothetical protein
VIGNNHARIACPSATVRAAPNNMSQCDSGLSIPGEFSQKATVVVSHYVC